MEINDMNILNWISNNFKKLDLNLFLDTWKKSFIFSGRSSRLEFWNFQIFMGLLSLLLIITYALLNFEILGFLFLVILMASIVPTFSIGVRRCHDMNLSGFYVLATLVPIIGPFLYYAAIGGGPSKHKENKHDSSGT